MSKKAGAVTKVAAPCLNDCFNIAVFLMPSFLYLFVSGSQTISFFFLDF
ncbi:hypothetical protein IEE87_27585 (plasmid) [Klebsiella pneumoniae]|nr:hypothetical protein IEE87_27585 [Klebsiella pneumoniae]